MLVTTCESAWGNYVTPDTVSIFSNNLYSPDPLTVNCFTFLWNIVLKKYFILYLKYIYINIYYINILIKSNDIIYLVLETDRVWSNSLYVANVETQSGWWGRFKMLKGSRIHVCCSFTRFGVSALRIQILVSTNSRLTCPWRRARCVGGVLLLMLEGDGVRVRFSFEPPGGGEPRVVTH